MIAVCPSFDYDYEQDYDYETARGRLNVFTGLIETVGRAIRLTPAGAAARLTVDAGRVAEGVKPGDSVAVNGACLTATRIDGTVVTFDVSAETLRVATVGSVKAGDLVNLERSLRAGDRMGGHFVLGHVDAVGEIARLEETPGQWTLDVRLPEDRRPTSAVGNALRGVPKSMPLLVPKGSVAVDGISLTIAGLEADRFSVAVIPTTLQETTLSRKKPGDRVNIEFDIIGKYVARLMGKLGGVGDADGGGLTRGFLAEHGF